MKLNSLKKIIISIVFFFLLISCKEQNKTDRLNTTITIHYKKEEDKSYAKFQQYDSLPLKDYPIIEAPDHTVEDEKLKTVLKFTINKPTNLLLGFNEFYIQPNDSFDIDYEVIEKKYLFKDSIRINSGSGAILQHGQFPDFYNWNFIGSLKTANSKQKIGAILNINTIVKEANSSIQNINLSYLEINKLAGVKTHLQLFYIKKYYMDLILVLKRKLPLMNDEFREYTIKKTLLLSEALNEISKKNKDYMYWVGMKILYENILDNKFKKNEYLYKNISQDIVNYDDVTKQFFYLNVAKNIAILPATSNENFKKIIDKITNPSFKLYAIKLKKGNTIIGLKESIKNSTLLDYNLKKVAFNDLFEKTSQKYLYFDFCGSWCMPCVAEIKKYSVSKKFDNSNLIKPFWIFFEDNQKSWLAVIKKYGIKKENCFLIENENADTFKREFAIDFNWVGEFPHHFIFEKNGNIINTNAPSLTLLNLKKISDR
jgi:hypothetical protein